ncbi:MAG: OB-fold domain-containing protein [Deltaproteobacteria bacterium]|nr:OB-fold domain-containing protein [Deltaproteobacteria bacterium]
MNIVGPEGKMIPALPDLFVWNEDQVQLMSAHCQSCDTYFFPAFHEQHRPGCSRQGVQKVLLNKNGILKSYTIQHYMPPLPFKTEGNITPYIIGLVEFPEGIQIAGIVKECPFHALKIGLSMEVVTFTLYRNEQGQEVVTWAFQPTDPIRDK